MPIRSCWSEQCNGGAVLLTLEAQAALGQSEMASSERNGSRGDQDDLLTSLAQAANKSSTSVSSQARLSRPVS